MALVRGNTSIMTSPDGINWTGRTSPKDNDWTSITYGNGVFAAVSLIGTGNRVMTFSKAEVFVLATNNIYQVGISVYGNVGRSVPLLQDIY